MYSLATQERLASAAAVFAGRHGDVSRLARRRGACRQRLYRQAHAAAVAVEGGHARDQRDRLRQALTDARDRLADAQARLRQAVVLDGDRQAEFVATAQAQGVSLSTVRSLLVVLPGAATPSRAHLGRLARAAGRRAVQTLAVLDRHSRPRARPVAADEIFAGKRPVRMTVEQESLCWLGGRLARTRDGTEWAAEWGQRPAAEQITRDGGQGRRKGLELVNGARRRAGQRIVADQDDHFHLLQRARRALHEVRHQATWALRQAEQAQAALTRQQRQGRAPGGLSTAARHRWRQAEQAFDRWSNQERAFTRLRAALALLTPQGQLNTRADAEAQVQAALAELTGPEWTRVRRRLVVPQTFTFLDRVHEQRAALPLPEAVKASLVQGEGLRRRPELLRGETPAAAALRGVALVVAVVVARLGDVGPQAVAAVRGILRGAWRASSMVEGLNNVVRMHQGRQKRLTQGLVDLQRLHWNTHRFEAGRRKGPGPYQRLGLVLPGSWWELLQKPPEQLERELSTLNPAA
jgi:hypothetical protein